MDPQPSSASSNLSSASPLRAFHGDDFELAQRLTQLPGYSRSLLRIQVPVVAMLATTRQPVSRVLELAPGTILHFSKPCDEPLSLYVDLHGTETNGTSAARLEEVLPQLVRLTPKGIRTHLGLNKPIYVPTAAYGHFGRKASGDLFTWEKTDLVDALKQAL